MSNVDWMEIGEPPQPSKCPAFTDGRHRGWGRDDRTCACGMVWDKAALDEHIRRNRKCCLCGDSGEAARVRISVVSPQDGPLCTQCSYLRACPDPFVWVQVQKIAEHRFEQGVKQANRSKGD